MTVKTQNYGTIIAEEDTIINLIRMLRQAKRRYNEMGCDALAADVERLEGDLRTAYFGPDDFEI